MQTTRAGAADVTRFGGFSLGTWQLALPMQALREVVVQGRLADLPCPCPAVVGGMDLRGVLVPVLDLRLVFGQPAPALATPTVIVVVHDGCILGLLADGVTGFFATTARAPSVVTVADPVAAILSGTVRRDDLQHAVSILSPAALAALPLVPWLQDPEPARQACHTHASAGPADTAQALRPLMLMRCGSTPLAIDALAIHTTLADPPLRPSVLAQGACRGVVEHGGQLIAALDLHDLCGLGPRDAGAPCCAFVLRTEHGQVALLIDELQDIVGCASEAVVPLARFALTRPALFEGAVPVSRLPADAAARVPPQIGQFLLLDDAALRACAEVASGAATNTDVNTDAATGSNHRGTAGAGNGPGGQGCSLITFQVQAETAVPIEQVQEILPLLNTQACSTGASHLLGVLTDRGRSIPVVCLSRLLLNQPVTPGPTASVLVTDADGTLVGFAVPGLRAIERSDWQPEVRALAGSRASGAGAWPPRQLARVGLGPDERMLPVLNLVDLARQLVAAAA